VAGQNGGVNRRLLAVGAVALALLAGCTPAATVTMPSASAAGSGYLGAELTTPYQLPDVILEASTGKDFNLRTGSTAPVMVLYFGYTNCPDICLGTLTDLASALNRVPEDVRAKTQVVLVTVDPERDTATVLADYLARIDPDFLGLTGDMDKIRAVAAAVGVAVEGIEPLPDGGYDVTHTAQVIGVDARRQGVVVWTQGTPISTYRADLERLVRQQG
jgi:protein SCO1/2